MTRIGNTIPPIIMVQWKMGRSKSSYIPFKYPVIFHWTMIRGGRINGITNPNCSKFTNGDSLPKEVPQFTRWWLQIFFIFTPIWGRFPIWLIYLIFFRWVETTNQFTLRTCDHMLPQGRSKFEVLHVPIIVVTLRPIPSDWSHYYYRLNIWVNLRILSDLSHLNYIKAIRR